MLNLRQWQQQVLDKALAWYARGEDRHFILNAAPGAGKTLAATAIALSLFKRHAIDRAIVIAPRKTVVEQWAKEFEATTKRPMAQITGSDADLESLSPDLAATWSAIKDLQDVFQAVCRSSRTLVICDEHHHAAIEAAWGRSADSAFASAIYVLILTGTPVRSDGSSSIWLEQDRSGAFRQPEAGTYTLTYGQAVDLGYCRPVTFHRHHGGFSVAISDDEAFDVSSRSAAAVPTDHPALRHLQKSLDFYKLAKKPRYGPDGCTPLLESYHGSMVQAASAELDELRDELPEAGGLVIAPDIETAEVFADLIEQVEERRPIIVHSKVRTSERKIDYFRRHPDNRWIVSVGMISEGVDIPRLRVLIYLPNGTTELMFRQAVGRVVRSLGPDDRTRAYVVMPAFAIFEQYARTIEEDMPAAAVADYDLRVRVRRCPVCRSENEPGAADCDDCGYEFPKRGTNFRSCPACEAKNPIHLEDCQNCGHSLTPSYEITLQEALRDGVITRGVEVDEDELVLAAEEASAIKGQLRHVDDQVARFVAQIPKEMLPALRRLFAS